MLKRLHLTLDEYNAMIERGAFDRFGNRIELFRGELVEMSPVGFLHDDLIAYLTRWSILSTQGHPISVRVQSGLCLLEQQIRPEPDLLWVLDQRYIAAHPQARDVLLVIEVSDSSREYDRTEKSLLYAQAGIVEFWLVDLKNHHVVIHRNPSPQGYLNVVANDVSCSITPLACDAATLSIRNLFSL